MVEVNFNSKQLPLGWIWADMCDVAQVDLGKTPKKSAYRSDGKYKIIKFRDVNYSGICWLNNKDGFVVEDAIKDLRDLSEGDVLVTASAHAAEHIGKKISFVQSIPKTFEKVFFVGELLTVRAFTDVLNAKFAFFYFISREGYLAIQARVKGVHLTSGEARKICLPIPPLSEQDRIIEKIEELFSDLDKGIENLKTTQQQLKIYRQTVLKWAFEGRLTAKWREEKKQQGELKSADELLTQIKAEREKRDRTQLQEWNEAVKTWEANGKQGKKPGKPNKTKEVKALSEVEIAKLPELPEAWTWIHLEEILDKIEAGKSFRCEERTPSLQQVGVAKVSAVTWGEYNESESKTCLNKSKIETRFLIREGDFLFSRANTVELVGACVIVKKTNLRIMLSDKTLRFLFSNSKFKKYVLYFLKSRLGRSEIERLATGNQESMRNIGQDRIQSIKTPLPSFEEQHQIVQEIEFRLSICDRLEATITENLQRAEALRQSILKQAFEGKLVPQDPNDEPAEKLIERIRQEKLSGNNGKQLELKIFSNVEDE